MANIIPAPIRKAEHLRLIDEVMADRLAALPLDKLLIYLVDTVDAQALPYLAEQFDVLGFKGWALIDTSPVRKFSTHDGDPDSGVTADELVATNEATGHIIIRVTARVNAGNNVILASKGPSDTWAGKWLFGVNSDGTVFFCWQDPDSNTVNYTTTATATLDQQVEYIVEMVPDSGAYVIRFFQDLQDGQGRQDLEDDARAYDAVVDPATEYIDHSMDGDMFAIRVTDGVGALKLNYDPNEYEEGSSWESSLTGETYALVGTVFISQQGNSPEEITQQQRELIKRAIELHRYKGTPWSIREALRSIGFANAVVLEGPADDVGFYANGVFACDGEITAGSMNWACFAVVFDLGGLEGVTADRTALLREMINEYKNVRSRLVAVAFQDTATEEATPDEQLQYVLNPAALEDSPRETMLCNGTFAANGRHCVNGGEDFTSIVVRNTGGEIESIEYL